MKTGFSCLAILAAVATSVSAYNYYDDQDLSVRDFDDYSFDDLAARDVDFDYEDDMLSAREIDAEIDRLLYARLTLNPIKLAAKAKNRFQREDKKQQQKHPITGVQGASGPTTPPVGGDMSGGVPPTDPSTMGTPAGMGRRSFEDDLDYWY